MQGRQRKLLSQNFFVNRELVKKLVRDSSISHQDTVLEIGAGHGILTQELALASQKVIALELDSDLIGYLRNRFSKERNITLINADFLNFPLPQYQYKVFANIPFSITGEIIRKLLQSPQSPTDCYLVIQKEAADKFIPNSTQNTMAAILYHPWWEIGEAYKFAKTDFFPPPHVESVLLHIQRRALPLVPPNQKGSYYDFVSYHFTRDEFSKYASPDLWLKLFINFSKNPNSQQQRAVKGSFTRLQRTKPYPHSHI